MDLETSEFSTPTLQPTPEPTQKKCGHLPIIIILTIIAVGGVGFGAFEFYQNITNNSEISNLNNQLVANNDVNDSTVNDSNLPSVESAGKILENYIGAGSKTNTFLNAFYDTFVSDFDDNQKAFLAYSQIEQGERNTITCTTERYEKGACTMNSINYDLINKKYQSLFGDSSNMKKENYAFHDFFYLVYNSTTDAYDEYTLQGGGYSPVYALHKVVSTKSVTDGFIATVSFMEMNLDVEITNSYSAGTTLSGGLGVKDETVEDAIESMAIYEFKFAKNGDAYVLTDVTKLGDK